MILYLSNLIYVCTYQKNRVFQKYVKKNTSSRTTISISFAPFRNITLFLNILYGTMLIAVYLLKLLIFSEFM